MSEASEAAAQVLHAMGGGQDELGSQADLPSATATQIPQEADSLPPPLGGGADGEPPLTEKQRSARSITPNSDFTVDTVKHWKGGIASKPGLQELRAEVVRRTRRA